MKQRILTAIVLATFLILGACGKEQEEEVKSKALTFLKVAEDAAKDVDAEISFAERKIQYGDEAFSLPDQTVLEDATDDLRIAFEKISSLDEKWKTENNIDSRIAHIEERLDRFHTFEEIIELGNLTTQQLVVVENILLTDPLSLRLQDEASFLIEGNASLIEQIEEYEDNSLEKYVTTYITKNQERVIEDTLSTIQFHKTLEELEGLSSEDSSTLEKLEGELENILVSLSSEELKEQLSAEKERRLLAVTPLDVVDVEEVEAEEEATVSAPVTTSPQSPVSGGTESEEEQEEELEPVEPVTPTEPEPAEPEIPQEPGTDEGDEEDDSEEDDNEEEDDVEPEDPGPTLGYDAFS
ncbi:hypothetical protein Q75_15475 [Bacillus coahuilensis p1.1.43]|uniref:Uncharacterized protein n=1 Tax=Bacillus coahuilensis p1.1.43 TaxID=1150625 RepID=A0A147K4M6_9BACI|nr:hypothetical protein [Bacillus coahuilensis]KUP04395.1 hypothetical protein Q75_15475 [Bacillus coahuilensis p1.1.43]